MAKLVPDPESSTRALFWHATGHRDTRIPYFTETLLCCRVHAGVFVVVLQDDEILDTIVESGS